MVDTGRASATPSRVPAITLLTDFGTQDGYVGAMKGVLAALAPGAAVIDITHDIPAGDVRAGAYSLSNALPTFPVGTVHVAVVDPGVGSARRPVAVYDGGSWFVGPDNGLFSFVVTDSARVFVLDRPEYFRGIAVSATFHGRDVFAPVAAALATGRAGAEPGTPSERPLSRIDRPLPYRSDASVRGCVVHVDRFGNLVTNLRVDDLAQIPGRWVFRVGSAVVSGFYRTYADVEPGQFVALEGSGGMVEISVRDGSAKLLSGAERDSPVTVGAG